jgi:hypothetical protein
VKFIRAFGILLIVLCAIGFLTVADDLRHVGELVGVSAIGILGVILLVFAQHMLQRRPPGSGGPH